MQLTFKASSLIEALDYVSIVEPRALSPQQSSTAFLFNCSRDRNGEPICRIYSRSDNQVARAAFPLIELEGEGLFTVPSKHIALIKSVPDDTVTINYTETKEDGEGWRVTLHSTSGTKYDHTTYNPKLLAPCEKDYDAAVTAYKEGGKEPQKFNVGVLREALAKAKSFLPGPDRRGDVPEHFNTIQLFDQSNPEWAKGDGVLFCSDHTRAFFFEFEHEEFKNQGFTVHARHVGKLVEFFGKCDKIHIYRGQNLSFAVNVITQKVKGADGKDQDVDVEGDQLFAWNHDLKTHSRYMYYGLNRDKYVIMAPKATLLSSLNQAEILIDQKQDRVKLYYTAKHDRTQGHTLHFGTSESAGNVESFTVTTTDKPNSPEVSPDENFSCFVNLTAFKSIIQEAGGHEIELRISPIPPGDPRAPKGGAMLRTLEVARFTPAGKLITSSEDGAAKYTCKVTRFMPSTN